MRGWTLYGGRAFEVIGDVYVSEPWWVDHVEIYAGGALRVPLLIYSGLWDSARL